MQHLDRDAGLGLQRVDKLFESRENLAGVGTFQADRGAHCGDFAAVAAQWQQWEQRLAAARQQLQALNTDATLTRVANIPGHMELDHATGMLYIADTGAGRIMRLDTSSGTNTGALSGEWDGATYTGVEGADFQVVVDGLEQPSGLALHAGHLLVSDHATGEIVAFDLDGNELDRMSTPARRIMGIEVGPAGDLWYVDAGADQVVRVDP